MLEAIDKQTFMPAAVRQPKAPNAENFRNAFFDGRARTTVLAGDTRQFYKRRGHETPRCHDKYNEFGQNQLRLRGLLT